MQTFPDDFDVKKVGQLRDAAIKEKENARHMYQIQRLDDAREKIYNAYMDNLTKKGFEVHINHLDADYQSMLDRELYARFPDQVFFYGRNNTTEKYCAIKLNPDIPFTGLRDHRYWINIV